jgi:WD40 repeat protein
MDTTAKVWDLTPGRELLALVAHGRAISGIAFSPDGSQLATAGADGTVRVWDFEASTAAASGEELLALSGHSAYVPNVEYSLDGSRLATASRDGTARVWQLTPNSGEGMSGEVLVTLLHPNAQVWDVTFSPDAKRVATGTDLGVVHMWDVATGEELWSQDGHTQMIHSLALNPDGTLLVTGSWDTTAKVWDAASGEELFTLTATEDVFGVAFSPMCASPPGESAEGCDELLAVPLRDGTTTLWLLPLGPGGEVISEEPRALVTLEKPTAAIRAAFSPDGVYLATVHYDGTTSLWDVEASIAAGSGQAGRARKCSPWLPTPICFPIWPSAQTGGTWPRVVLTEPRASTSCRLRN